MALFDFLRKKTASIPVFNVLSSGGLSSLFSSGRSSKELYTGWVYTCVRAISEEVAKTELVLTRTKSNGEKEVVDDHDAINILRNPNPVFTKYKLFERLQSDIELEGNEYWFVEYKGNTPFELYPLNACKVKAIPDRHNYIKGYEYRVGNEKVVIPIQNMIHFRTFNPESDIVGLSTLSAARIQVDTDESAKIYNNAFFRNSAQPGAIIEVPSTMSKDDKDKIKQSFNAEFKGPNKAYRTAVIGGEVKVHRLQMSQADMEFVEQRRMSRDEILAIFRVPKTIVGILEDANFAAAKTANYVFVLRTILPKLRMIEDTLNYTYLPLFGDSSLKFEFLEEVPEDEDVLIRKYDSGIKNGWMSINDVRRKEGLPEIEGGETVMVPLNLVPFGEPKKKELRELPSQKKAKAQIKSLVSSLKEEEPEEEPAMSEKMEKTGEFMIKQRDIRGEEGDRSIRIAAKKLFSDQQKRIIGELEQQKNIKAEKPTVFDKEKEIKITIDLFTPIFAAIMEKEGEAANEFLGIAEDFVITPNLRKFLERNTKKFAKEINNNTAVAVRAAIATGLEQGEAITELSKRIKDLTSFNDARVELIARSETIRAQTHSEIEVWKETGVVDSKVWYTAQDERVCPFCGPMHGKEIQLKKSFFGLGDSMTDPDTGRKLNFNYETVVGPPLHPGCRCTLIPVVAD